MSLFTRWMFVFVLVVILAVPASGATINVAPGEVAVTVNGNCSLREALANAEAGMDTSGGDCAAGTAGADTVVLAAASTYTVPNTLVVHSDYGNTGLPQINSTVTITGNDAIIQRDPALFVGTPCGGGGDKFRIFYIGPTGNLTLNSMSLQNGCASFGPTGAGGALFNRGTLSGDLVTITNNAASASAGAIQNDGTLTLTRSTLSNNATTSGAGGAIVNTATMTLLQSTINNNATPGAGGGIDNTATASAATVANSTLSANLSRGFGGGLHNRGNTTFTNVTVALNYSGPTIPGAPGPGGGLMRMGGSVTVNNSLIVSQALGTNCWQVVGSNNIDTDGTCAGATFTAAPLIGPLANNGGPTSTHTLLAGSPAIDTGNAATCSAAPVGNVDQRGIARPRFGASSLTCDVGAVEAAGPADLAITTAASVPGATAGDPISFTITVTNNGPDVASGIVITDTFGGYAGVTASGASPSTGTFDTGSGIWNIPSLGIGASATLTLTLSAPLASGTLTNTATLTASDIPDPVPGNNSAGASIVITGVADLSVAKTLTTAGPYSPGQALTYTIVVANAGPSPASNILVSDTPTNLTITAVSGAGCAALPCTIPFLASGANTTINVTATIDATGTFDNAATVASTELDPSSANNSDNTGNGGFGGSPTDIPTLSTWMIALFVLMLGLVGVRGLRG